MLSDLSTTEEVRVVHSIVRPLEKSFDNLTQLDGYESLLYVTKYS